MKVRIRDMSELKKSCTQCGGTGFSECVQKSFEGDDHRYRVACRRCNKGFREKPSAKTPVVPNVSKSSGQRLIIPNVSKPDHRQMLLFKGYHVEAYPIAGYIDFAGLRIAVENTAGSKRRWYDVNAGKGGETTLKWPYGYIVGYQGADGDEVDCYVGPHYDSPNVYVVHQMKAGDLSKFDEHKVMLGFISEKDAKEAYLANYDSIGPKILGHIEEMKMDEFKAWLNTGSQTKPVRRRAIR